MTGHGGPMRLALVALVLITATTACGTGGPTADPVPTATAASPSTDPLADAVRIDAGVDVSLAGADFTGVDEAVPVAVDDVVRTDGSGFAEIAYFDGSLTRLDVDTELVVLALADGPDEAEIKLRMGLGRTWNRVTDDVEGRDYIVETSVATASVRGTVFLVDCPAEDRCTFTVLDGEVEVTPMGGEPVVLTAVSALEVTADGEMTDVPAVVVPDDDWLTRNSDLDGEAGFAPLPTPEPLALQDLAGEWIATANDIRIAAEAGAATGGTLDTSGLPSVVWTSSEGVSVTLTFSHGPVTFTCDVESCEGVRADGTVGIRIVEDDDGTFRAVPPADAPCLSLTEDYDRTLRDVTPTSFSFLGMSVIAADETCADHAVIVSDSSLVRADQ